MPLRPSCCTTSTSSTTSRRLRLSEIAGRLAELVEQDQVVVLVARAEDANRSASQRCACSRRCGARPHEAYLAELYVVPDRRGQGFGRELITEAIRVARERGADYAFLITSEDDRLAQRLYEAAGFRRTEGEGGPLMLAYEQDL